MGAVHQAVRNAEHDGAADDGSQVRGVAEPLDEDEPVGVDGQYLQGTVGEEKGNAVGLGGEARDWEGSGMFLPCFRPVSLPPPSLLRCSLLRC